MMTTKAPTVYNLNMTLILAISSKDRVIVAADGKSMDTLTNKISLEMPKIFELSENTAASIAGMGLESIDKFMRIAAFNISQLGYKTIGEIAHYLQKLIEAREWAENDNSFLHIILVGYKNDVPCVLVFGAKNKDSYKQNNKAYALGNWNKAEAYLVKQLNDNNPEDLEFRAAEMIAIRMIVQGEAASPKDIGGQEQLWHIFPDRIERKTSNYTARLRKKYGKSVK